MATLWIETNDLSAAVQRFREFRVAVLQPSDGQSTVIADPDGIVIEVWQSKVDESS